MIDFENFNKDIEREIDWFKDELEYLETDEELKEDIKNKDPIIEAFQKTVLVERIILHKKIINLYEKAFISEGTEKMNLVRKAMLVETESIGTGKYDLSKIETDFDSWPEELKEEFENFKKIL